MPLFFSCLLDSGEAGMMCSKNIGPLLLASCMQQTNVTVLRLVTVHPVGKMPKCILGYRMLIDEDT
jgi:hypothetical protein